MRTLSSTTRDFIGKTFNLDLAESSGLPPVDVLVSMVILAAFLRITYHFIHRTTKAWVQPPASARLTELLQSTLAFASRGFFPTPWLFNGHLQTLFAAMVANREYPTVRYQREVVTANDGGAFTLDWALNHGANPDESYPEGTPVIMILHGLTGGSQEAYIKSLVAENLKASRYRCVVFNARGCAGSQLETPQFFCASYTNDLRLAVRRVQAVVGKDTPMAVIGYSLGSNILVKYLGEEGENTPFVAAVSVGNPFDLMEAMRGLDRRWFYRNTYSKTLAGNLKRAYLRHRGVFDGHPEVDADHILKSTTVYEFDDRFTRRMFGYPSVRHYYRDSSSDLYVTHVAIPLLCLQAEDDPVSVPEGIPFEGIATNPFVTLVLTNSGGHIGWFSGLVKPEPWSTQVFLKFFDDIFEAHRKGLLQKVTADLRDKTGQSSRHFTKLRSKFLPEINELKEELSALEASSVSLSSDAPPTPLPSEDFGDKEGEKATNPVPPPPPSAAAAAAAAETALPSLVPPPPILKEQEIVSGPSKESDSVPSSQSAWSIPPAALGAMVAVSLVVGFLAGRRRRLV